MNQTVEQIRPETIALIEAQAKLAGLSVDEYLRSLIPKNNVSVRETETPEERSARFLKWANSHHSPAPALLLEEISRETIY